MRHVGSRATDSQVSLALLTFMQPNLEPCSRIIGREDRHLLTSNTPGRISVVVCARNRAETIADCLDAVQSNEPFEVIVVDGNSTDGTWEIASSYTSHIVSDAGAGLAAARQMGADLASGEYIAYVDSDTMLSEGCLRGLAEVLDSDPKVGAAHAQIRPLEANCYWSRGVQTRFDFLDNYRPGEKDALGCMAVLIRRELVTRHRFDPFFTGAGEDGDFFNRVHAEGWKLLCSEPIVYHRHRKGFKAFFEQRMWYGRGAVRLAIRGHPRTRIGLLLHPVVTLTGVFGWRCLRHGRYEMLPFVFIQAAAHYAGEIVEIASFARSGARRVMGQKAASQA